MVKSLGTYITLLIHEEETIVILGQKVKGSLDVLGDMWDFFHFIGLVVVANGGIGCDANGSSLVDIIDGKVLVTNRAPAVLVGAVQSTVRHVGLSTGGEVSSNTSEYMLAIIGVEVFQAIIEDLRNGREGKMFSACTAFRTSEEQDRNKLTSAETLRFCSKSVQLEAKDPFLMLCKSSSNG